MEKTDRNQNSCVALPDNVPVHLEVKVINECLSVKVILVKFKKHLKTYLSGLSKSFHLRCIISNVGHFEPLVYKNII